MAPGIRSARDFKDIKYIYFIYLYISPALISPGFICTFSSRCVRAGCDAAAAAACALNGK